MTEGIWSFRMRSHYSTGWSLKIHCPPQLLPQANLLAGYLRNENLLPVTINAPEGADIFLRLGTTAKTLTHLRDCCENLYGNRFKFPR